MGSQGKVIPGTRIQGATVQVKGRTAVVTQSNGTFSFPIPANKFSVLSVKKQGYILSDPEATNRQYNYSSNPLIFVMDPPEQKTADKLQNERKIRNTLQQKLKAREDEIEALKEQNKLTNQQYQEALTQLYEEQQSNERLISDMAEHFAQIDFDQQDELNLRISDCILNGRLTEADSLLRSKGDIDTRIASLNRHHQANEQVRANLEKSETLEQMDREDIAQDCYNFYGKFFMDHQNDSAARYIELRAALDENNPQWQLDAGTFFMKCGMQQRAGDYYQRALAVAREHAAQEPQTCEPMLAYLLNNVALLQAEQGATVQAEELFKEALAIYEKLRQDEPQVYDNYSAAAINNLAVLYSDMPDALSKCEPLFMQALDIYWSQAQDDPAGFMPHVAKELSNLGLLYDNSGLLDDSEKAYNDALEIYRRLAASQPELYSRDVAATLNNYCILYLHNNLNAERCEQMLEEAIQIYSQLAEDNLVLYGPKLAATLSNQAVLGYNHQRPDVVKKAREMELEIYRKLAGQAPAAYLEKLAHDAYDLGVTSFQAGRMDRSSAFFQEALEAYRTLAATRADTYRPDVARVLRNLATALDKCGQWEQSGDLYLEELEINKLMAESSPAQYESDVARSYGNLANHALLRGDFQQAADYALEGLNHDNSKLFIQANLALAYLCMGDTTQALEIYHRFAGPLRDTFLEDLHQFTELGIIPQERQTDVEHIINFLTQ